MNARDVERLYSSYQQQTQNLDEKYNLGNELRLHGLRDRLLLFACLTRSIASRSFNEVRDRESPWVVKLRANPKVPFIIRDRLSGLVVSNGYDVYQKVAVDSFGHMVAIQENFYPRDLSLAFDFANTIARAARDLVNLSSCESRSELPQIWTRVWEPKVSQFYLGSFAAREAIADLGERVKNNGIDFSLVGHPGSLRRFSDSIDI